MTTIGNLGRHAVTLACNSEGVLYIVDDAGFLCTVNKTTGAVTVIGYTGIKPYYVQSMAFEQSTGRLFWAMSNNNEEGKLIEINPLSGATMNRGKIGGNAEIIALHATSAPGPNINISVLANPEEGGTVTGAGIYYYGQNVTVTATPATETGDYKWVFEKWTKGNFTISVEPEYVFYVTEEVTLVAHFKKVTSIEEMERTEYKVYPNPVFDVLTIVRSTNNKTRGEIYNITGAKIMSFEMNETETEINVSTLSSGVYFIKLRDLDCDFNVIFKITKM
jgi:hypothetical protein